MSFLNMSHSFSAGKGDIALGKAIEGSFRFSDELGPEDFMELLSRRIVDLEREVAEYDESEANKKTTKSFLKNSNKRLNDIVGIISNLQKEKELLSEIPETFLMEIDSKVQTVKRLLQLKKVNPDQMSVLSQSVCKSEQEEEIESLIAEKSFNEQGHLKIDPETTIVREKRIRRIENKFEYVNMICADLNGMVETQGECIRNLEGNFAKGVENTAKASKELQKLNQYHESSSKKVCVLILLLILAAAGTVFFVRTHPHANFRLAIPKLQ